MKPWLLGVPRVQRLSQENKKKSQNGNTLSFGQANLPKLRLKVKIHAHFS